MSNTYDENLLAEAPAASREARQEGYNIDLLESERPSPPIPSRTPGAGVPPAGAGASFPPAREVTPRLEEGQNDYGSTGGAKEVTSLGDRGEYDSKSGKKVPWHRTTRGVIILAVLALIIIAAAVGGGVGGALGGKSNNNKVTKSGATPSSTAPAEPSGINSSNSTESETTSTSAPSTSASAPIGVTISKQNPTAENPITPSSTVTVKGANSSGSNNSRRRAARAPALLEFH